MQSKTVTLISNLVIYLVRNSSLSTSVCQFVSQLLMMTVFRSLYLYFLILISLLPQFPLEFTFLLQLLFDLSMLKCSLFLSLCIIVFLD